MQRRIYTTVFGQGYEPQSVLIFKGVEVAKLTGVHINTITKIKKLGLFNLI